jgi:nucleoside-diphosphate-sugar epimerase
MRYFLTGATGFLGRRLAGQLLDAGHQLAALARDPDAARDLTAAGAEVYSGDVTERDSLRAPMAGADGLFHVAGWYKVGRRHGNAGQRVNVDGTRNVLEVMRELGVPKGVYTSSLAVNSDTRGRLVDETYRYDGPHLSEYDRSKAAAHRLAEDMIRQGLPLVVVMPGLIYGPGDSSRLRTAIHRYLQRRLPALPRGQTLCWAHVDDIARAHVLAMEKGRPGETYIIAGPPHTTVEFYQMAEAITGVPAPRLRLPPGAIRALSVLTGLAERLGLPVPDDYASEYLRMVAGVTYLGDNAKARRELGYAPRPLRQGLEETLEHEIELLGMTGRQS